jgi:tetratricopeptide (TPR) repeat protein
LHPQANYHLGRRLAERGRFRDALPLLHKALERDNQGAPLQAYLLAVVYRELADSARARQYAQLALAKARAGGHGAVAAQVAKDFGL